MSNLAIGLFVDNNPPVSYIPTAFLTSESFKGFLNKIIPKSAGSLDIFLFGVPYFKNTRLVDEACLWFSTSGYLKVVVKTIKPVITVTAGKERFSTVVEFGTTVNSLMVERFGKDWEQRYSLRGISKEHALTYRLEFWVDEKISLEIGKIYSDHGSNEFYIYSQSNTPSLYLGVMRSRYYGHQSIVVVEFTYEGKSTDGKFTLVGEA